jgi:beta-xylosidase
VAPGGDTASPIVVGNVGSSKISRAIDFPDPFVLRVGPSTYYAYSTGNFFGDRIQVIESTDNRATWNYVGDAFTGGRSGWSDLPPANTWGPSVLARSDGKYVLYYASLSKVADATNGKQCIGRAVSASPAGPFTDEETAPLVCTPWLGGSIDPSPLLDSNGTLYLIWKSEGVPSPNYVPTQVWSIRLTSDGLSTSGGSTALLTTDNSSGSWEFPIIEGPTMMKNSGTAGYTLFYSAYVWATADYKVGAASCTTPTGPCTRAYSTPVLPTRGDTVGPGGASVFQDSGGSWWVAFHAWSNPYVGYVPFDARYARSLRILPLTFQGGSPKIG